MGTIKANNRECADCMLDLVTKWVRKDDGTGDLPRTWETVVKAVKASGHKQLAEELAKKYVSHPSSKWTKCQRRRKEEATQPGADSVIPPEEDAPFGGRCGPYHQHNLVGSETVWLCRRATTASEGIMNCYVLLVVVVCSTILVCI